MSLNLSDVPPLNAVRVFAVAAQFGNFKRAADHLGVTSTAVSAQIKSLERFLGCPLFERNAQSVELNAAGESFAESCEAVFARLERGVVDARKSTARSSITVGVGALIGSQWLSRRLFSFWQRFPETSLHLQYSPGEVEFSSGQTDLMLAWGDGSWPGLVSEQLLRFEISPVIAPALLAGRVPPSDPVDLLKLPLLHWKDQNDWAEWFEAHGVRIDDQLPGVIFDDSSVLLQAVLSGQGVSLGLLQLIEQELQSAQLIRPFTESFKPTRSYHIVYPRNAMERPQLRTFRNWIVAEASKGST